MSEKSDKKELQDINRDSLKINALINKLSKLASKFHPDPAYINFSSLKTINPSESAKKIRNAMGLGDSIPSDYIYYYHKIGIRVVAMNFSTDISGFFNKLPAEPFYTIYINSHECAERNLFSLAQIMGHIIYYSKQNSIDEKIINQFAANFLMPENILLAFTDSFMSKNVSVSFKTICIIKSFFRVSAQALLYRLLELKIINKRTFLKIEKEIKNYYRKNNFQEPEPAIRDFHPNSYLLLLAESIRDKKNSNTISDIIKNLKQMNLSFPQTNYDY